ncbi:hypothetical protein OG874_18545 [Nocardia sp. NBC_00565]|uniref:hypothetical protein n=1 Tax=Nocardia sp. NBC_00565 TaxID=2975993 RepID=UPI002E803891|nr:hypothetical protein [Nocardia sp. NBC_00565]WUC06975.1 hypothetical protein OG874_18545 [Nocardia sp. NBC_00565]
MSEAGPSADPHGDRADGPDRLLDAAATVAATPGHDGLTTHAAEAGEDQPGHAVTEPIPVRRKGFQADAAYLQLLRAQTASVVRARVRAALGPRANAAAAEQLEAIYTGALLNAGLGYAARGRSAPSADQVVQSILNRR